MPRSGRLSSRDLSLVAVFVGLMAALGLVPAFSPFGASVPITAQSTIDGYSVCVVLNQGTTADDAATEAKQTFDLPADEAAKLVAAAKATLCQLAGKPR